MRRGRATARAGNDRGAEDQRIFEGATERLLHVAGDLIAVVGILGQRLHGHFGQSIRHLARGIRFAWVGNRVVDVPQDDPGGRVVDIRKVPGQKLEEHDAERIEVAAPIDAIPAALLWRHVVRRSADQAGFRDRALFTDDRGKPEVDDLDQVIARSKWTQNDVLRLQISVHDAELVRFA